MAVCGTSRATTAATSENQCNGLDERECLLGIRFAYGILKKPFENHTRIEDDYHGRSTDRALRTCSLVKVGRPLRATLN